jgi:hypothetical protein
MMRYIVILLITLSACSPCRHIVDVEQTDSVSHVAHERDSVSHTTSERDSIYLRDSIYVYQRGDTLYHFKERQVVRWIERVDTLTKYVERSDTTSKIANRREESIAPAAPATETIKWYDRGAMWVGRLCLLSLLLWLIFLYIKRKR